MIYANWKTLFRKKRRLNFRKLKGGKAEGELPYVRIASEGFRISEYRNIFLRCYTNDLWNKKKLFQKHNFLKIIKNL